MNRKTAFISTVIIAAVIALSAAAFAQTNQSEGFILAHVLSQGETVSYKITQQLTGMRMLPGASQATPIECEMISTVRIRLVKALGKGNMELAAETESATLKMPGKEPRNMPVSKTPRTYRITPSGTPVEITKGDKVEATPVTRSILDSAWLESLVILAIFPETAVNVGSEWKQEMANPLKTDVKTRMSGKMEDLKQAKEGRIATVKEVVGIPYDQAPQDDPNMPGSSISGDVTLRFVADQGRLLSAEGSIQANARTRMGMPGLPKGDLPMGSATAMKVEQINSKFRIETVPPAPVPKPSG